jgi:hypothetical protein
LYVRTQRAAAVAVPSTTAPDPTRTHFPENDEPHIHPLYSYIYVADECEGLILVGAATLLDGNPANNFLERALTYNPDGLLAGARDVTIAGTYAYVACNVGLVIVNIDDPLHPFVASVVGPEALHQPRDVQVQFRYAFVCDDEGVKVLDVTDPARPVIKAAVRLPDARRIYVARTYAYVAGGEQGLVILDVSNPEQPRIDQVFNAGGKINDLHDVKLGITYVSQFAYLADGRNGLCVVQLTSPETSGNDGFSPRPTPQLVASYAIGEALAISEGVDRDRAVDESGNQLSVFGRVGARPLNAAEQRRLYLHPAAGLWRVIDGERNYNLPPEHREADLARQLEQLYNARRP